MIHVPASIIALKACDPHRGTAKEAIISALALHLNIHTETLLTILLYHSYDIFSAGTIFPLFYFHFVQ